MKKYLYVFTILVLVGCNPNLYSISVTTTSLPSAIPTTTSTKTPTASPTITPTSTIPSSPIPTPIAKEENEITLELIQTNNGCDLPCWWGIIPNKTRWKDAERFFKRFSTIYYHEGQPPKEWEVYEIHSHIAEEYSDVGAVRMVFAAKEGVIKEMEVGYFDEATYNLDSVLSKYGIPSQIFISTYSSDYGMPPNQVPFSLDLYYPDLGINFVYGTTATVNGSQIYGCFYEGSEVIFLWSPQEYTRSIDYILGWDKHNIPYLSIRDAIGIDTKTFYENFKRGSTHCLQTPTNLWYSQ